MRITTDLFVGAYLRRLGAAGIPAVVARHGDDRGGAVLVRVDHLDGRIDVYGPAPAGFEPVAQERKWVCIAAGIDALAAGELVERQVRFDSDLWVIDVDDRQGRHLLGDDLIGES